METLTTPCPVHGSADANEQQLASQTCPLRRVVLSSSSPFPPMTDMTGEPKVNGLQPACAQASILTERSFCDKHDFVDVQHCDQSLVSTSYDSSVPVTKYLAKHTTSTTSNNATWTLAALQLSTLTTISQNTLVLNIPFNANTTKYRDLTKPIESEGATMATAISAPGTPPELTESRSSKSSSYGSQFSTENDLSTEITNFEDIGLDDDNKQSSMDHVQSSHAQVKMSGRQQMYHNRRPTLPNINCQPKTRSIDGTSRSAVAGPMKRGFTSPSPMISGSQSGRPRSSSPPKRLPRSTSSISINATGSLASTSPRSSYAPSRRASWQPQRKTIKEIEAEYHDSDDELPDDANLWNVPVSPSYSMNTSRRSSFRGSPEREHSPRNPQPLPLELTQSDRDSCPRKASFSQQIPRQRLTPRSSSTHGSRPNPSPPRMPGHLRNGRAKSWNLAMADLSPEARIVSENLEHHVDSSKSNLDQDKTAHLVNHRSSAPSTIQLPPIQKSALDFMPISKEKEAVLSRTRPSWLPPKDPKEEQRHLKEYQRMMAASIEAEKKKENKLKSIQCERDSTRDSLNRIWDFYVNPTTDITIIDRRVHDLCWRGIPARVRGKVWQRAIGNPLGLTSKTYHKAVERAISIKSKKPQDLAQLERSIASWFADIDRDAETAFPELGFFQRDGPMWHDLVNICQAYTCYRSDIGYMYGLQLIGALVLLQIPEPSEAFIFMANCLNKPIASAFHTCDIASIQRTYNRVISNLGVKFPRLHDYLFEPMERGGLGLTGQEVLEPIFRTLFCNGLDFDRLCRVWDIWIFEGDRTLIRAAVAVLGSLQSQIFDVAGDLHLKRRNVQEMLGWGPFNRTGKGCYWSFEALGDQEAFIDEIGAAGKLDYTGH